MCGYIVTLRSDGNWTELEPFTGHHNGDRLPQPSVDRYIKVKKGIVKCYLGLVEVSAIPVA